MRSKSIISSSLLQFCRVILLHLLFRLDAQILIPSLFSDNNFFGTDTETLSFRLNFLIPKIFCYRYWDPELENVLNLKIFESEFLHSGLYRHKVMCAAAHMCLLWTGCNITNSLHEYIETKRVYGLAQCSPDWQWHSIKFRPGFLEIGHHQRENSNTMIHGRKCYIA